MAEKNIAYETMKEFVEKYENMIKPAIEKGNTKDLIGIVGENKMRYDLIKQASSTEEYKALAHYRFAIDLLSQLVEPSRKITEDIFNYALDTIESQVQKINDILTN